MEERHYGVWVSDKAELIVTEMVWMYFEKLSDDAVKVMVRVEEQGEDCTLFTRNDGITRMPFPKDLVQEYLPSSQEMKVNGHTLVKAEDIEMCEPYDMPTLNHPDQLAERLTEWRLGTVVGYDDVKKNIIVQVQTPRNCVIYMVVNGMYYLRTAIAVNANEGTFFYQNIHLCSDPRIGKWVFYFSPDNRNEVTGIPTLDMHRFHTDSLDYDYDKGWYWRMVSATPDLIHLYDTRGKDYYVTRKTIEEDRYYEWIKYPGKKDM